MPVFLNTGVFEDKKLYGVLPKRLKDTKVLAALLNSTFSRFFIEYTCRQLTGAQAIADIDVVVVENLSIPDPSKLTPEIHQSLRKSIDKFCMTSCNSIFSELGASSPEEVYLDKVKPDRRELDKIIMGDILGLTDEEQLEVYRAVVDLVSSRIKKAKSVDRKKKIKGGIDVDAFVKTVMERVGEETLGKFYQENILSHKPLYTKKLPKPTSDIGLEAELGLKFEKDIHKYRLYSGKKYIFCKSEPEARYLKVWVETGLESVKVPKDENCLAKIVPQLEKLMEKIKKIIESYTNSILQPKLRQKILHQLWQKITEGIE